MWCPHCQADTTPAEAGPSAELRCSQCGNPVSSRPASADSVRQARDILARWSTSNLLDEISALPAIPPIPESGRAVSESSAPAESPGQSAVTEPIAPEVLQSDTDPDAATEPTAEDSDEFKRPHAPISTESVSQSDVPPEVEQPTSDSAATVAPDPASETLAANDSAGDISVESEATESPPTEVTTEPAKSSSGPQIPAPRFLSREPKQDRAEEAPAEERSVEASQPGDPPPQDSPDSTPTAENKPRRPHQLRAAQRREKRERDGRTETGLQKKKASSVTRKFRIDGPGGSSHSFESPTSAQQQQPQPAAEVDMATPRSNSSPDGRRIRIDSGQAQGEVLSTADSRTRTQSPPRQRYIDEPHESPMRGPHFEVTRQPRSNLTAMTGQFLAYLGVLGLTIGTALVIYGHFGGYSEYTPTGWLVTTVAQMMLFLGVINLVSGGIEKNNDDVSARINHLGEQLMRIEQVTEEVLRGPRIPAHRYADPDAVSESERETVAAGEHEV